MNCASLVLSFTQCPTIDTFLKSIIRDKCINLLKSQTVLIKRRVARLTQRSINLIHNIQGSRFIVVKSKHQSQRTKRLQDERFVRNGKYSRDIGVTILKQSMQLKQKARSLDSRHWCCNFEVIYVAKTDGKQFGKQQGSANPSTYQVLN